MKKLVSILLTLCMVFALAACAVAEPSVKVAALKGPTAMGMVKMMKDDAGATYDFSIHAAIDEVTPKLVKGEADIAAVPANLASVLYNNTQGKVKVIAINTLGILYIVENGDTVRSFEDLRGRTIFSSGKGAVPEYALNYLLMENGIDPEKDVTVEYKSEHSECLASLLANDGSVAVLAALAGNDMLVTTDFETQIPLVIAAVEDGTLPMETVDEAVTRILLWKYDLGLLAPPEPSTEVSP